MQHEFADQIMLALEHSQGGRSREAAAIYRAILASDENHYEANYSLGMLCHQGGRNDLAIPLIHKSVKLRPDVFAGLVNLGMIQRDEGLLVDARASLEAAVTLQDDSPLAHNTLGLLYIDLGEMDRALESLQRGLELEPGDPMTLARLGMLHQVRGEADSAAGYFSQVIELHPNDLNAHRSLALVRQQKDYNDNIRWMENAIAAGDCPAEGRMLLGFALGKSFDDLGDYDRAFECLSAAHALRPETPAYSAEQDRELFQRYRQAFGESFLAHCREHVIEDETAVFVLGMPRSGTTLTEQILASHPSVYGAGEVEYLRVFADRVHQHTGQPFPQGIGTVPPEKLQECGRVYLELLMRNAEGAERVVDKLPHNFLRVGLIAALYPAAKIILCEREPLDNCLSIYQNLYTAAHPWSADLSSLGRYYRLYQGLVEWWDELLPGRVYRQRYESLVDDTEAQVRQLLQHCGLPFHDDCLAFHKTRRRVKTPSEAQIREPIYRKSMGRWKNYQRHLAPLIEALES